MQVILNPTGNCDKQIRLLTKDRPVTRIEGCLLRFLSTTGASATALIGVNQLNIGICTCLHIRGRNGIFLHQIPCRLRKISFSSYPRPEFRKRTPKRSLKLVRRQKKSRIRQTHFP